MILRLQRFAHLPTATLSWLHVGRSVLCGLELPWRQNADNVSCIPLGTYPLWAHHSAKHPNAWRLEAVPDREGILIHVCNYPSQIEGCICVGAEFAGDFDNPMVAGSANALRRLNELLNPAGVHTLSVELFNPYSV